MISRRLFASCLAVVATAIAGSGCSAILPDRNVDAHVARNSATPWRPPADARMPPPPPRPAPVVPAEYLSQGATVSLDQVIDLALRNNPVTRTAWYQARAAAANVGAQRSEYFPTLELDGNVTRQKVTTNGGQLTFLQTTYGPSANLTWLLLDLGGRAADVAEARNALYTANWTHDAVIQDLVLQVETAYYGYQNAKAQTTAAEASLKQARESLAAAEERHRVGVATIADVLQARTAFSQAELQLETAQGTIQTLRGALATAVGVSPDLAVDVQALPEQVDFQGTEEKVEQLIERAQNERQDLAAARFEVERAWSHVRSVRADGLPTIGATGNVNRIYYYNRPGASHSDNYSGAILFRFPIFTGGRNSYETLQAKEQARAAEGQAETLKDQVVLQVWTSYYDLRTASRRVKTARDLLAAASQSQEVTAGRYRAGVGSILDLLTAQTAFANARAQEAQARSDWFVALAQLAHDTGSLGPPAAAPAPAPAPAAVSDEKKGSSTP